MIETLIGIFTLEITFFLFRKIVKIRSFFITIVFSILILNFSFGNILIAISNHKSSEFNLFEIISYFISIGYGFFGGIARLAEVNKKNGDL